MIVRSSRRTTGVSAPKIGKLWTVSISMAGENRWLVTVQDLLDSLMPRARGPHFEGEPLNQIVSAMGTRRVLMGHQTWRTQLDSSPGCSAGRKSLTTRHGRPPSLLRQHHSFQRADDSWSSHSTEHFSWAQESCRTSNWIQFWFWWKNMSWFKHSQFWKLLLRIKMGHSFCELDPGAQGRGLGSPTWFEELGIEMCWGNTPPSPLWATLPTLGFLEHRASWQKSIGLQPHHG